MIREIPKATRGEGKESSRHEEAWWEEVETKQVAVITPSQYVFLLGGLIMIYKHSSERIYTVPYANCVTTYKTDHILVFLNTFTENEHR